MVEEPRKKRTITEIRESKQTGEKMVYTSVPDYTAAQWAEMAGVDVAVLGDSLAMISHGHANTVPATMEMMLLHAMAVRKGAPNTFMLGCMPYQSYHTIERRSPTPPTSCSRAVAMRSSRRAVKVRLIS